MTEWVNTGLLSLNPITIRLVAIGVFVVGVMLGKATYYLLNGKRNEWTQASK